jgi:hypothetical protein
MAPTPPSILEALPFVQLGVQRTGIEMIDLAAFGRRLVHAISQPANEAPVRQAFAIIEERIARGGAERRTLVTAMFEAMQNEAFANLEPPDALDDHLLPRSLEAWRALIEGFTGAGVRSIAAWRARARRPA